MVEKRRAKRIPVHLELEVSKIFRQVEVEVLDVAAPITVQDVSKLGIGFTTTSELPMDYYFNARLELGSKDRALYCVVKIIRKQEMADGSTFYGCEYVGMAPVLDYVFDEFEKQAEEN